MPDAAVVLYSGGINDWASSQSSRGAGFTAADPPADPPYPSVGMERVS